jgi:hypothetical protein
VEGHGAPATADIEQAHSRAVVKPQFAANQVVLGRLGLFEGGRLVDEPGARVRQTRAKHGEVELVADVVVMADRLGVPILGVTAAPRCRLHRRWVQGKAEDSQAAGGSKREKREPGPRVEVGRGSGVQRLEEDEEVAVHLEFARPVGPADAEFAGRAEQPVDGAG